MTPNPSFHRTPRDKAAQHLLLSTLGTASVTHTYAVCLIDSLQNCVT